MWALRLVLARLGLVLVAVGADSVRTELEALGALSVNYSALPVLNDSYVASVEFDMRAMGPLYNNSHYIIDGIVNKQAYPEGFVVVSDGHVELSGSWQSWWRPLAAHYAGPLSLTTLLVLLACVLPLAGLLWCCCRCCRRRPRRPFDRKYDGCWKAILAILLIALLTCFLFGIVCLFATESQVQAGALSSGRVLRAGAADARTFLRHSALQARHVLVTNYQELEDKLRGLLGSAGITVALRVGSEAQSGALNTLHGLAVQLDGAGVLVQRMRSLTDRLRLHAERLNAALRRVRAQLLMTLSKCDQPQCRRLKEKHRIGQLDTEIHYSQMPDMSELLVTLSQLSPQQESLSVRLAHGQRAFRTMQQELAARVDGALPPLYDEIHAIGVKMSTVADEISYLAGNASERIETAGNAAAETADHMQASWGPYRQALSAGVASCLTCVLGLVCLGLLCGVCGHRPDHYGRADCCNKANGSRCLLCGVMVMFVLGAISALLVVVYFLSGISAQRLLCDPLTEPRDNRLLADVERFVDLERLLYNEHTDPHFNLTYVMVKCHANHTLYEALQLSRLYPLEQLSGRVATGLRSRLATLAPPAPGGLRPPVSLIDGPTRLNIARILDSGVSDFDFDRVLDALETNMTSLSLSALSDQLEAAAAALRDRAGFGGVAADLRDAALQLRSADQDILQPLLTDTAELNSTALQLRAGLRPNNVPLRVTMNYSLQQIDQAEAYLNTEAPYAAHNMTVELAGMAMGAIDEYMWRVRAMASAQVARCGPLSHAANATRDHHCRAMLMPINGYWIALCWCLILLPPIMAVCTRLARLYRSLDPYPGPLVEAEYLYDAYADRDNVPLANAYSAEKRSVRESRRAGGGAGAPPTAGPASASATTPADNAHGHAHGRRYNDMAPKHWEDGPPRYLGPTEYERPPPYYYPGPHDRQ